MLDVLSDKDSTRIQVTNTGVAPIYREAWFSVGSIGAMEDLGLLMPGDTMWTTVLSTMLTGKPLSIYSHALLDNQVIEFEANVEP